MTWISTKF